jgi:hypothetical protein
LSGKNFVFPKEEVEENLSTVLETQNPRKETKSFSRRKSRLIAKQIFCVFGRSKFLKIQKTFSKKFFWWGAGVNPLQNKIPRGIAPW